MEREEAWAPPYVARDLSGTIQAAEHHRQTAEIRAAEARAAPDPAERAQLEREASEAAVLADTLGREIERLSEADTTRAQWYARSAETRAAEQRARFELDARGIDPDAPEDRVTAEEWLAEHRAALGIEEPLREVTEADIDDLATERAEVDAAAAHDVPVAETAVRDIREVAAVQPPARENVDDWTYLPTPDEVEASVVQAQRALAEMEARRAMEAQHETERVQADELARRHEDEATDAQAHEQEPADALTL